MKHLKRIKVVHRTLGELTGYELRRIGGRVEVKLDAFEQPALIEARYVSEASEASESEERRDDANVAR